MPFPKDKDPRDLSQRFVVGANLMINKERLEVDYILGKYREVRQLSSIGPINYSETAVYRKSDKKLLGKAVNLSNRKGWWHRDGFLGHPSSDWCPVGHNDKGISNSGLLHHLLLKKVFLHIN